jgi:chromosome segregation ATPase
MNMKSFALSLLTSVLLASAGIAPAMALNTRTPNVDRQQASIHARIGQGARQGYITQREARQLYQRERQLNQREARIKADGRVSPSERSDLQRDVASLRAEVERKMSNRRTVPGRY